ncbi:YifB family Mg chelatase-like AAA ATPase [Rothia nasimurium]|uniref:YifB family Mg chelatase-like AAA ATPase n=1 Tax=Rothia nasimurium TaxID=85336 RepID=UPI001F01B9CE|nr:YifB family Mg chelatase-like AAA ATPase [Rothia nasimurium]
MGFARTYSVALVGVSGHVIEVEADISAALPGFVLLGLPDHSLQEAKDRIRSAAKNTGIGLPQQKLTVNLSPSTLPKRGTAFDLAMVVAALQADGELKPSGTTVFLGETGLDGSVREIAGILPAVKAAVDAGYTSIVVPRGNAEEAKLVVGADVTGVSCLAEVFAALGAKEPDKLRRPTRHRPPAESPEGGNSLVSPDMADVSGQQEGRLALEIAAAGGHHLLLNGPPGSGKTMLAERLTSILPQLDTESAMEVTAIHSLCAAGAPRKELMRVPPFEAPHHTATSPAILGGGSGIPKPGCVSKAHRGVLFLDEAPEFKRTVLDSLRQPLESGEIVIDRSASSATYPARFQLILAANPCPCGNNTGRGLSCTCSARERRAYFGKLSGPLLDRIDLQLAVPKVTASELAASGTNESSSSIRARVVQAREAQRQRLAPFGLLTNSETNGKILRGPLKLDGSLTASLSDALDRGTLTARGFDRVLRTAWTLADLDGKPTPGKDHLDLALYFRNLSTESISA